MSSNPLLAPDSANLAIGDTVDLGTVAVTREMIRAYAASVDDQDTLASDCRTAPATFLLSLRRGMTPAIVLPPNTVSVYGVGTEVPHQPDGVRVVCELLIENADGDRTTAGQATLRQPRRHDYGA